MSLSMFMVTSASSCCLSPVSSLEEEEEEVSGAGMKAWPHGLKGKVAPWKGTTAAVVLRRWRETGKVALETS